MLLMHSFSVKDRDAPTFPFSTNVCDEARVRFIVLSIIQMRNVARLHAAQQETGGRQINKIVFRAQNLKLISYRK
jgi:hypothetical protein